MQRAKYPCKQEAGRGIGVLVAVVFVTSVFAACRNNDSSNPGDRSRPAFQLSLSKRGSAPQPERHSPQ